jgi:hypothetical protein
VATCGGAAGSSGMVSWCWGNVVGGCAGTTKDSCNDVGMDSDVLVGPLLRSPVGCPGVAPEAGLPHKSEGDIT